ncbi:hypothetical protein [Caudoviricetes sp.]|nr:hypothetical protein [Caudoviricetes sp.]
MGQFKPMVKMFTDEPSVILKLKKGGKVASKAAGQSEGFKSMASNNAKVFEDAESGKSPKKPSMAERRRAMNPNQYAKGGKVANKQIGGAMPVAAPGVTPGATAPAPVPMQAMGRQALAGMPAAKRMARAAAVRKAMTGMKKGGSACMALEKELKHHEALSASKAHGKASGGAIDKFQTKTTIEGNEKKFAKTKVDTSKRDRAHGTGEIKEGKPGGYATGGAIPADTKKKVNAGKIKMKGTIEGNEGDYAKTEVHTAKRDKAHGTGGIKESNAGGFAKGGKVPGVGRAIEGGDWENRPADTSKPGIKGGTTGGVKEANAGGFKKGGSTKKAFATGGNVVDDGKAEKMPRHFVSRPVANSLQSGTFKKGGKVKKFAEGGTEDLSKGAYDRHYANEKAENEADRKLITSIPKRLYEGAKSLFSPAKPPEGSVTKTEKSVTVTPRKRGGPAKC